jgi:hypothetical protein
MNACLPQQATNNIEVRVGHTARELKSSGSLHFQVKLKAGLCGKQNPM